jgi:dTDP-4-dehydrorhamnose reductase
MKNNALILVAGGNGLLGRSLAYKPNVVAMNKNDFDITDPEQIKSVMKAVAPRVVINCAAYTDVKAAETQQNLALKINADGPKNLAEACMESGAHLIHISTDYVFGDKSCSPILPHAQRNPLNFYGFSKSQGEKAIEDTFDNFTIIRTSWLFGPNGEGFPTAIRSACVNEETIDVVSDQVGGPTSALALSTFCLSVASLIDSIDISGVFHYCGFPYVSWFEFAQHIVINDALGCDIRPINSRARRDGVNRPSNSRLDCSSTKRFFDVGMHDWRDYA